MKKCATCDHEYEDLYDACPRCAQAAARSVGPLARLTNPSGRSNRREHALVFFGGVLASTFFASLAYAELQRNPMPGPLTVVAVASLLAQVPIATIAGIRRLHDLGKSGWMLLLAFVPVVNLFVITYLLLAPGIRQDVEDLADARLHPSWRWASWVTVALVVASVGATTYYTYYSQAVRKADRIPIGATMDDVAKIAGRPHRIAAVGGLKYLAYAFSDGSNIECTYLSEQQVRTRRVLRSVEVHKTRQSYRQVGWDFYLGIPEYGYVFEPYTTTQLKLVDEDYQVTTWKVCSLRPGLDVQGLRRRIRIGPRVWSSAPRASGAVSTPRPAVAPAAAAAVLPSSSRGSTSGGSAAAQPLSEDQMALFSITHWNSDSVSGWEWFGSGSDKEPQMRSFSIGDDTKFLFSESGDYQMLKSVSKDEFFSLLAKHTQASPGNQNGHGGNVYWRKGGKGTVALKIEANVIGD